MATPARRTTPTAHDVMGQPGGDPGVDEVMSHASEDPPLADPTMAPPEGDPIRELRVTSRGTTS